MPGLEPLVLAELARLSPPPVILSPRSPGAVLLAYDGELAPLLQLRTVSAFYRLAHFDIPRPKAFLGHQHWQRCLGLVAQVQAPFPTGAFGSFRIGAAGRFSSVFRRLKAQLQADTGLRYDEDEADLQLRIRPARLAEAGWELLLRLTPRPLSTRSWRVFPMEGALNATIAAAMVALSEPAPADRFLNLMCGSGTLLVERGRYGPAAWLAGGDVDEPALAGARLNLDAAGLGGAATLLRLDAGRLPLAPASVDVIVADPPWGQLVGETRALPELYPAFLAEATRVAAPGARLLVLTHQIRLWQATTAAAGEAWAPQHELKVFQGGLYPRLFAYRRR